MYIFDLKGGGGEMMCLILAICGEKHGVNLK